jgi:hypothetical protein
MYNPVVLSSLRSGLLALRTMGLGYYILTYINPPFLAMYDPAVLSSLRSGLLALRAMGSGYYILFFWQCTTLWQRTMGSGSGYYIVRLCGRFVQSNFLVCTLWFWWGTLKKIHF